MRAKAAGNKPPPPLYQIKVTLKGIKPPIWRRLLISGDTRLDELHDVLQTVMGWDDSHLHQFRRGRELIGVRDRRDPFGSDVTDERKLSLSAALPAVKSKLLYDYDFGDGWEHELVVEKILPPDSSAEAPRCLAGKRACPPEDCGGVWGYADLLEAISDPSHPQREGQLEWLGDEFDPEAFEPEIVNAGLRARRSARR